SIQAQIDAVYADPEVNIVRVFETDRSEPKAKKERGVPAIEPITRTAPIVFQRNGENITLGNVELVYSSETLNQSLTQTTWLIGFLILGLIFLQVVGIYLLVGRLVTKPLHQITALTGQVVAGNYNARVHLNSQDEMNILADAFNGMTMKLTQTLESLEQRVKDRTADLETSKSIAEKHAKDLEVVADISRSIASIQNLDHLLSVIANSISEHLGYYHIGIYLLNENGDFLNMKAASGEGGQRMLRRNSFLPVESNSLVGFVANRRQIRIAQNVEPDVTFMPDLPDTRSEIGLPLITGRQVIGVLDVQSTLPNAFSDQDVKVLTTLANQIAISVQNARLFEETRRALAEAEKIYQQFVQQGWSQITKEAPVLGYKYSQYGLSALETSGEGNSITLSEKINQDDQQVILSIPITLRDQAIGAISIRPSNIASRELDEDELAIIQATVERMALALENARLLEDSQRRATRERAIGEISAKLSEKSEIDSILRSTAEELGKKLRDAEITVEINSAIEK
ncbi:MAG TPA: GAF domain-containing protein, partial [Nitrosomonas sp.]|nr:GAF domain-containing protein [Nitrosomonas sp.]